MSIDEDRIDFIAGKPATELARKMNVLVRAETNKFIEENPDPAAPTPEHVSVHDVLALGGRAYAIASAAFLVTFLRKSNCPIEEGVDVFCKQVRADFYRILKMHGSGDKS